MTTRIQVTLEDVTMLVYWNGLTMAVILSTLIPAIINSEASHRLTPTIIYGSINTGFRLSDCEYNSVKLLALKRVCVIKPTQRSGDASSQCNRMDGKRRAGAFRTLYNTNGFPLIATKARATFTIQLATMMKCWAAVSVIFLSVNPTYNSGYDAAFSPPFCGHFSPFYLYQFHSQLICLVTWVLHILI